MTGCAGSSSSTFQAAESERARSDCRQVSRSSTTWAQLAYLALACTVFAFLAQTWAIRRTSPSRASLLMGTEPVWAVLVGVSLGGERLTLLAGAGAVLVVAATYYGQHVERVHRLGLVAEPEPADPARRLTSA